MDSVDIPYAESKGIKVLNTPDGPTRAVSELTLGLTMSFTYVRLQLHIMI